MYNNKGRNEFGPPVATGRVSVGRMVSEQIDPHLCYEDKDL